MEIIYNCEPTKEQINYAFQRLITPLTSAIYDDNYKTSVDELYEILKTVIEWKLTFDKTNNISSINKEKLNQICDKLYDLDGKYLSVPGLYMEESYEWILQIKSLIKKS